MKYTVFSVSSDRKHYVDKIERECNVERVDLPSFDGRKIDLRKHLEDEGLYEMVSTHKKVFHEGHLGIWLGVINALKWSVTNDEELLTFQDDAILIRNFNREFALRYEYIPKDYDFFSLFTPLDHTDWYWYTKELDEEGHPINGKAKKHAQSPYYVNSRVCRAYQRYGGVSILYSPRGARRILDTVYSGGFLGTYDEHLYKNNNLDRLRGYISIPSLTSLVSISSKEPSIIGKTKPFKE